MDNASMLFRQNGNQPLAWRKLNGSGISLAVNLFRRRNGSKPAPAEVGPMTAILEQQLESTGILCESRSAPPATSPAIALSAEHKSILEKPLDPRVGRILQELHSDRAAAENALKARRIIQFPVGNSSEAHVEQGDDGFWRIMPGPPPGAKISVADSL